MKKLLLILLLILPFTVKAETKIDVYYGKECPYCQKESQFLKVLKKQLGSNIDINKYEVWHSKKNETLMNKVKDKFKDEGGVPYVVIGNKSFIGYNDEIGSNIKKTILNNLKKSNTLNLPLLGKTNVKKTSSLKITLASAISDSVSLGSLWVMLVLTGILISIYNNKKRLILGSIFALVSAVTYMIMSITNLSFTLDQTTFIRSFISICLIIIGAIIIDAYMKINIPKKSILQKFQELFGKKQMIFYALGISITSIIISLALVNQAGSLPTLFKIALDIQNISKINIILYFIIYLIMSFIMLIVLNKIIKELIIENTIGTYNRLISGIILLICAGTLLFIPSLFMFA